jgi:hypothetical protein
MMRRFPIGRARQPLSAGDEGIPGKAIGPRLRQGGAGKQQRGAGRGDHRAPVDLCHRIMMGAKRDIATLNRPKSDEASARGDGGFLNAGRSIEAVNPERWGLLMLRAT